MATDATEVVDAEVVPDGHPEGGLTMDYRRTPEPSTALAVRERRSEVMRPLDVTQLVDSFQQYQDMLPQLLHASDYQESGRNQDGTPKRFVKKSGWRKIATAFDLDLVIVTDEVERDERGKVIRARVVARAIAPSGRTMDGDGYCSIDEERFARGDSKAEHNLRSTATTRAKNRAIADLVGMGDVSAEEVTEEQNRVPGKQHGPEAPANVTNNAKHCVLKAVGGDTDTAAAVWKRMTDALDGYMPFAAAVGIISTVEAMPAPSTQDVPWDPEYQDPTGDIPSESDMLKEQQGLAIELWSKLETPTKARKRVKEAGDNRTALTALIDAASKQINANEMAPERAAA